jgi:hypothetical protein
MGAIYLFPSAKAKLDLHLKQINDHSIQEVSTSRRNCIVVSKDSDLCAVPGLTVEDWSQQQATF